MTTNTGLNGKSTALSCIRMFKFVQVAVAFIFSLVVLALLPHGAYASVIITGTSDYVPDDVKSISTMSTGEDGSDNASDESWYDSSESSYTISKASDFKEFQAIVNGTSETYEQDSFEGKTVSLGGSINLGDFTNGDSEQGDFSPIGSVEHPFKGTFDGNNNSIYILHDFKVETSDTENIGLFGYVGESGTIKNVTIMNASVTVTVKDPNSSSDVPHEPVVAKSVGALVGYCAGQVENCKSSSSSDDEVRVRVYSDYNGTESQPDVITEVGGLVGTCLGNITGCSFDGTVDIECTGEPTGAENGSDNPVASKIGGVVGAHGGDAILKDADGNETKYNTDHGDIENCTNSGNVLITTTGSYWSERWVQYYDADAIYIGGVAGYTIGNVKNCENYGTIGHANTEDGKNATKSYTSNAGGVIGGLRPSHTVGDSAAVDDGTYYKDENDKADDLVIENCKNYGDVNGFVGVAGVIGCVGSHTTVTRCSNAGTVDAWRWNKPCPGGVVSRSYGTVCYCYNTGTIRTLSSYDEKTNSYVYSGGYYAAGVVSGNWCYEDSDYSDAENRQKVPDATVYACYNAGTIQSSGDYRQGAIVGSNEGIIKFCSFWINSCPQLLKDNGRPSREITTGGNDENSGSEIQCYAFTAEQIKSGEYVGSDAYVGTESLGEGQEVSAIGVLNSLAPEEGWENYFLPNIAEADSSGNIVNDGYPVLNGADEGDPEQDPYVQTSLEDAKVELKDNAVYSASGAPTPTLTVTLNGVTLVENVDYKVVVDKDATEVTGEGKEAEKSYSCTITGMGRYTGDANGASYGIVKANLGDQVHPCSITVSSHAFDWGPELNLPEKEEVVLYDSVGGIIDSSEYTVSFPDENGEKSEKWDETRDGVYVAAGSYNVTVTADTTSKNYTGNLTQKTYQITKGRLYSTTESKDTSDIAKLSTVVYTDPSGNVDTRNWVPNTGDNTDPVLDNDEFVFNGTEIKPVAGELTYHGVQLIADKDYRHIYGNFNPDTEDATDGEQDFINVTDDGNNDTEKDYLTLTIRYAGGSNFSNWLNIKYRIVPLDLGSGCDIVAADQPYSGTARTDAVTVTVKSSGVELIEGVDYTISYKNNTNIGTASYTVTPLAKGEGGSGNLTGEPVSGTFEIAKNANYTVIELSGENRYATAAEEALYAYPEGCDTVILASGEKFADALSATSLAGALNCPILLSKASSLDSGGYTSAALKKLKPGKIIVVGGTGAVSDKAAKAAAKAAGISDSSFTRIAGSDRYGTAEEIYDYGAGSNYLWGDTLILANAWKFADALSISPAAYANKYPILLVDKSGNWKSTTRKKIKSAISNGCVSAILVGGKGVVSNESETTLAGSDFFNSSEGIVRLSGKDRYETSEKVAEYSVSNLGLKWNKLAYASGKDFPDALAGGVVQGKDKSVVLLVSKSTSDTVDLVKSYKGSIYIIKFFGGKGAVSTSVRNKVLSNLGWK